MKKQLAVMMAVAMAAGSMTVAQAAITFSDINQVPWSGAETYINGAAEAGLMVGEVNSSGKRTFRPKDKVTYCETMQLAYSVLKAADALGDTTGFVAKWQAVMNGYNIPTWAQEAVAYGLQNNILSVSDVSRFMNGTTQNNAKREDVAVIFGKALYVRTSNNVSSSATLKFADASKVASTSVPYVDLLYRMEILVGDNNNNFNPKNYINRSEMAVMSLKTNNALKGVSQGGNNKPAGTSARGIVTGVSTVGSNYMVTVYTSDGNKGYLGNASTSCKMESTGADVNFLDITQGDVVTVYYSGSEIKSVVVHTKVAVTTVSGKVDEMSSSRIYVTSGSSSKGYDLADTVTLSLDGSNATVKEFLEQLKYYDIEVSVTVNANGQATRIVGEKKEGTYIQGTLTKLTRYIADVKRSGSTTTTYDLASDIVYKLDDEKSSNSDIQYEMDRTTLTVRVYRNDKGEVNKLYAYTSDPDTENKGTISSSISSSSFKMKSGSTTKTYYLASDATFKLDGSTANRAELNTAIDNYGSITVTLTTDRNGDVTRITATSGDESSITGTISSNITSTTLSIKKTGKTSNTTMVVSSSVKYYIDGESATRSEMNNLISDEGTLAVTLSLDSSDRVIKVTASSQVSTVVGKVEEEMSDSYLRIIKDGKTSSTRYYFADNVTYKLDGSSSSFSSVNRAIRNNSYVRTTLKLDNRGNITTVTCSTEDSDDSGMIQSLSYRSIRVSGETYDLMREDDMTIRLDGNNVSLDRLIENLDYGDEISATLRFSGSEVRTITAYTRSTKGDLRGVYSDSMSIKVRKDSYTDTYDILDTSSNSCTYYVDGSKMGNIEDFEKEINHYSSRTIRVSLTLNSDGKVTKIDAEIR